MLKFFTSRLLKFLIIIENLSTNVTNNNFSYLNYDDKNNSDYDDNEFERMIYSKLINFLFLIN